MNQEKIKIRRALISVSDKTKIVEFAHALNKQNIEMISTGGTCELLRNANIPVLSVEEITQSPEMMDGRVKTLHPRIHGGILGLRDKHALIAQEQHIKWIDLVIVNLYPFAQTIQKKNIEPDEAIEQIDIGGPTLIRSAAKNMQWVGVVVDPSDYSIILQQLEQNEGLDFTTRKQLAKKAFLHTTSYDRVIYDYLERLDSAVPWLPSSILQSDSKLCSPCSSQDDSSTKLNFPALLNLQLQKSNDLRYGENPHQSACAYQIQNPFNATLPHEQGHREHCGILSAKQHQGKTLSYNNIADGDAAIACLSEFSKPAAVIVKHANPCGVAVAHDVHTAFQTAFAADSLSAFGGIVAINQLCDEKTAQAMLNIFLEVIIAPAFTPEALVLFRQKPNLRLLEYPFETNLNERWQYKFIAGGVLIQNQDTSVIQEQDLRIVTRQTPSAHALKSMLFAWPVLKHLKSNAILIAKENKTIGIGTGQVSRIDAVDIALKKAGNALEGSVLASDAFFPFRDSIDRLAKSGISGIIQPGGSQRDAEVIAACDAHGIPMVFTGKRCFNH